MRLRIKRYSEEQPGFLERAGFFALRNPVTAASLAAGVGGAGYLAKKAYNKKKNSQRGELKQ